MADEMYCYNTSEGGTHEMSRAEILAEYFEYWKDQMTKAGKEDQISEEHCIEDWCVVNWAWKV